MLPIIAFILLLELLRNFCETRAHFNSEMSLLSLKCSLNNIVLSKTMIMSSTNQPHLNISDMPQILINIDKTTRILEANAFNRLDWTLNFICVIPLICLLPNKGLLFILILSFPVIYLIIISIFKNSREPTMDKL
jgi:hypothetical protein